MPPRTKHYWLLKTEPSEFSIDDLLASPQQTTFWFGVRNYQARNLLRDELKLAMKRCSITHRALNRR